MKLNIGCGTRKLDGYINIDIRQDVNPDICCDIRQGIPGIESGSINHIHAFAVIEHFSVEELKESVLPELYRILTAGGRIELLVPDLEELAKRYLHYRKTGETPYKREGIGTNFIYDGEDLSYWIISFGGHKIVFDMPYLEKTFEKAGFKTVKIVLCDHNLIGVFKK